VSISEASTQVSFDWFHLIADRLQSPILLLSANATILAGNRAGQKVVPESWIGELLFERVKEAESVRRSLTLASRSSSALPGAFTFLAQTERWRFDASALSHCGQTYLVVELRRASDSTARFLALNHQLDKLQAEIRRRTSLEQERLVLLERERTARMEAESANRQKDEFLASVSHELRTPLHAISGWVQLLRSSPTDAALRQRGLDVIERNVNVQSQLSEDLVDTALMVTGRLKVALSPVDLEQVVRQVVDLVRPALDAKDQRIEVLTSVGTCYVNADSNRLQQVFYNLLSNASRYTPHGGKIQLVLKQVNSHAEVAISDTGEGIRPELLPYVFDRFRRSDSSSTRRQGGIGLGLAIVRHLVELHGGVVLVDSQGVGKGATFTVSLPLPMFRSPIAAAESTDLSGESEVLSALRVLLVEDHADSRELLQRILAGCGANVISVSSSAAALQAFRSCEHDVLISDIEMPDEDGFTMMRKLRAIEQELNRSPVVAIAVSAHALADARLHALRAGYQSFLVKPLRASELVATVRTLRYASANP
jgi:signal transduction histidine kinase/ActR/RegA family two-component response regulator